MMQMKRMSIWGVSAAIMMLGPLLAATLATMMLDAFLQGPGPSSVTTRVPGFVYASATVMKVSMLVGMMMAVIALASRASGLEARVFPFWGMTAVALAPLAPLAGAVAVLTVQSFLKTRGDLSTLDMSEASRVGVQLMLCVIGVGLVAGVTALVRRERPVPLAMLGFVTNAVLVGLFWHFEFFSLGFDQDTWAPR